MKRILILLMLVPLLSVAAVYKWTDNDDNVHYSDQPHRGSKKVKLPREQTYTPAPSDTDSYRSSKKTDAENSEESFTVSVTTPTPDETIRENNGNVPVSVSVDPPLKRGYVIQVYMDGQKVGEPQANTSMILQQVPRGTHTVEVEVLNSYNKPVGKSSAVTFHMKQHICKGSKCAPKAPGVPESTK